MSREPTLPELLAVSWFFTGRRRTLTEAAAELGLDWARVRRALELLETAELPGQIGIPPFEVVRHGPNEAELVTARVPLVAEPLRLTPAEGAAVLMSLESLEAVPGIADPATVRAAAAKLRAVLAGDEADPAFIAEAAPAAQPPGVAAAVRAAVAGGRVLEMTYRSALDERRTRRVDPVRLIAVDGRAYLRAVDHDPEAAAYGGAAPDARVKSFRMDRIESARVLAEPAVPVAAPEPDPADPHGFHADPEWVEVRIDPEWTWVADYDPVFDLEPAGADPAAGYRGWIPARDPRRAVAFLLRRAPGVRAVDAVLAGEVAGRAEAALAAYAQMPIPAAGEPDPPR
ncbi:helix-turn-helix transcriptional regulator [Corynebacterium sphenisci]|uniref:helix-turn-helix transcriptional regulator n=1 Tax=Corynebacterium sphenisci TaxID=191493 RepID=UPI00095225FC|nr:WYL domain-containing protein [Corynebacterium sphenisci]